MVLQKKGGSAVKKAPPKKKGKPVFAQDDDDLDMFDMEDMDDDDFDDSGSDEEAPVMKTPQGKSPKGRQSLNEKKVSFQLQGKNTPAKTPSKNNSLLAKKQPTPGNKGKTAVQEFKGMKGKKNQNQEDDDDDEDEEEDDDDDDDEDDDLDLELGVGDDDNDDDDDEGDDDDEDDDDDDDDDEEETAGKGILQKKKQNNQKTPNAANNSKNVDTPKGKNAQNKEKASPNSKPMAQLPTEIERRRERDARMLFVGNLPKDVTTTELKTLSPDIIDVVMPSTNRPREAKFTYGFLVFNSEKKAEENYKALQNKKFRGQLVNLDFVGEKSKNKKPTGVQEQKLYNMKKLYVSGIPVDATLDKVAKFFPHAFQIAFNHSPEFRTATVNFATEEAATQAFESNKASAIDGQKLIVLHSVVGKVNRKHNRGKRPRSGQKNHGGSPAKRMRKSIKAEK